MCSQNILNILISVKVKSSQWSSNFAWKRKFDIIQSHFFASNSKFEHKRDRRVNMKNLVGTFLIGTNEGDLCYQFHFAKEFDNFVAKSNWIQWVKIKKSVHLKSNLFLVQWFFVNLTNFYLFKIPLEKQCYYCKNILLSLG